MGSAQRSYWRCRRKEHRVHDAEEVITPNTQGAGRSRCSTSGAGNKGAARTWSVGCRMGSLACLEEAERSMELDVALVPSQSRDGGELCAWSWTSYGRVPRSQPCSTWAARASCSRPALQTHDCLPAVGQRAACQSARRRSARGSVRSGREQHDSTGPAAGDSAPHRGRSLSENATGPSIVHAQLKAEVAQGERTWQ
jgi:hypothetical protein